MLAPDLLPDGSGVADLLEPDVIRRPRRRWLGRAAGYVTTLAFLVTINFFLPRAMPGNPLEGLVANPHSPSFVNDPATRSVLTHYYGLDRPLWSQFTHYLSGLAHGNLGVSITSDRPVTGIVLAHLPWTALLVVSGMALAAVASLVGGVTSGWRGGTAVDRRLLGIFYTLGYGPVLFLVAPALFFLAVKLPIVPLSGGSTPFAMHGFLGQVGDVAHHLVLPALVLALVVVGYQFLLMRGSVVSELGADYLKLGRAKGLRDRRLKYRYAARNALLPWVSATGVQVGRSVGIVLIVERLFAWPGLGTLMSTSVGTRDYPTMQGCFLFVALLVLTVNLLTDLLYARIDPRTTT